MSRRGDLVQYSATGERGGAIGYIKGSKEELFSDEEVTAILQTIEDERLAPGFKTHRDHVRHVRGIVADGQSPDPSPREPVPVAEQAPACPKCGKTMVLRTSQRGKNKGGKFWGCPGYPRCKGSVNVS